MREIVQAKSDNASEMFMSQAARGKRRALALWLAWALTFAPLISSSAADAAAQGRRRTTRANQSANANSSSQMTDEQRVAHVLSRLTFGARPADFERVRAMGVDAFIAQQLDYEAIDDSALDAKLNAIPTLNLPLPTLVAQYNPPKPPPAPSPSPSPSLNATPKPSPSPAIKDAASTVSTSTASVASPAALNGTLAANQTTSVTNGAKPQMPTAQAAAPKPSPNQPKPPEKNPQMPVTDLQRAALLRAVYSERQLYEVTVDFWENHFSIYSQKDADRWLLTQFDREAIRPFALGKFRDLLEATAKSPAMLYYLDNWQSAALRKYPATKDKPARTSGGVNENYARELMELHTLGVDGGYTQKDVQEVARCFTGWTIAKPNEIGLFVYNPQMHDNGEKIVLGHRIPAGGGIKDAETVLDILAAHPSTAKFIATKLCRRFISDDPPASAIERAENAFQKSGGDIKETLRAIFTSPEFFAQSAYRAKLRSPFEYAAAALRATNADTDGNQPMIYWVERMGQRIFGRLTPDGYPDRADAWLSTGSLLERLNFANALAANKIKGTRVDAAKLLAGVEANDPHQVAATLLTVVPVSEVSARTNNALKRLADDAAERLASARQSAIVPAGGAKFTSNGAAPNAYVADMLTLIIGSPEFQRR